mgnify:CR=1 FL=1
MPQAPSRTTHKRKKIMSYHFESTIGGKLFEELKKATADCIEYEGKSLAEWDEMSESVALELNERKIKKEKRQENIKNYRDQVDKLSRHDVYGQFTDLAGEFDRSEVHVDDDAQYRANMALASSLQIDLED